MNTHTQPPNTLKAVKSMINNDISKKNSARTEQPREMLTCKDDTLERNWTGKRAAYEGSQNSQPVSHVVCVYGSER